LHSLNFEKQWVIYPKYLHLFREYVLIGFEEGFVHAFDYLAEQLINNRVLLVLSQKFQNDPEKCAGKDFEIDVFLQIEGHDFFIGP
jgi:hypothetical protein